MIKVVLPPLQVGERSDRIGSIRSPTRSHRYCVCATASASADQIDRIDLRIRKRVGHQDRQTAGAGACPARCESARMVHPHGLQVLAQQLGNERARYDYAFIDS